MNREDVTYDAAFQFPVEVTPRTVPLQARGHRLVQTGFCRSFRNSPYLSVFQVTARVRKPVSLESIHRFARIIFDEHCHEGVFTIDVDSSSASAVKSALEELGCAVEQHLFRPRLIVTCPPQAGEREA